MMEELKVGDTVRYQGVLWEVLGVTLGYVRLKHKLGIGEVRARRHFVLKA